MLIAIFMFLVAVVEAAPGDVTVRSDVHIPRENIVAQLDEYVDTANRRSVLRIGGGDDQWTTLCRDDLGFQFMFWNHTRETPCLAIPVSYLPGSTCFVPLRPVPSGPPWTDVEPPKATRKRHGNPSRIGWRT